jgi:hypothetical protein
MAARLAELSKKIVVLLTWRKNPAENTKIASKTAVNVFRQYLEARKINEDDLVGPKETLANVLRKFYAEARKRDG